MISDLNQYSELEISKPELKKRDFCSLVNLKTPLNGLPNKLDQR